MRFARLAALAALAGFRKSPSLPVLRRLAEALGVPVTALLE
jgi:transcriptional regulator with XRE-family HTH domain